MSWAEFQAAAPELAGFLEERLAATGLVLLGTLRADGWPRISPNEAFVVDGELLLGMMWRSRKAVDLLRDPRLTVMTPQVDRHAATGDLKLYGRVRDVTDLGLRERYADTLEAAIGWRPSDPYHLFAVDVESAGYISFGEERRLLRWTPAAGVEVLKHPDA